MENIKIQIQQVKLNKTEKGGFGIVKDMAVLWEQRKMVCELKRIEHKEILNLPYDKKVSHEEQVHISQANIDGYWIVEAYLIDVFLEFQGKKTDDIVGIAEAKILLNSCIKDGFIKAITNTEFANIFPLPEGGHFNSNRSPRRLQVSEDKGSEILNWWYFWWKYIAGCFPPITSIMVAVLTAILTSGIIWLAIWGRLQSGLNLTQYGNQQGQVSR